MDLGTELGSAGSMPRNLFDKLEAEWRQSCDSGEMLDYALLHALPPAAEGSGSGQQVAAAGAEASAAGLSGSAAAGGGASIDNTGTAASGGVESAESACDPEAAHAAELQQLLAARQSLTHCRTAGPAADAGPARDVDEDSAFDTGQGRGSPEAAPSHAPAAVPEPGRASAQARAREHLSCSPALLQVQSQDTGLHSVASPAAVSTAAASAAELQQDVQEAQPAAPQRPAGAEQLGIVHREHQTQAGPAAPDAAAAVEAGPSMPAGHGALGEAVPSVRPSEHDEGPGIRSGPALESNLEQAVCPVAKNLARPQEPRNSGRSPAMGNGRRAKSPVNMTLPRAGGPRSAAGGRQSLNARRRAGEPSGTQPSHDGL